MAATNYTTPPDLIIAASYNSWSNWLVFFLITGSLFVTGLKVESRYGYEGLGQCLTLLSISFFAIRKHSMLVLLHTGLRLSLPAFPQYFVTILPQLLPNTCSETRDLPVRYSWPCERDAIVNAILQLLGQDHSLRSVPSGAGKQTFDDLVIPASLMIYFGCLRPFYRAYIHMRLVLWWYGEEEIVNWLVQMAEDSRKRKEDKLQEEGRMPLEKVK